MLTAIMSDFHSLNPMKVIERLKQQGVERFAFLGDYDNPEILEQLLELEADKLFVPGNHDAAFVRGEEIYSPELTMGWQEYTNLWKQHPRARDFVLKQSESGLKLEKRFGGRKIVYVHGLLTDCDAEGHPNLWGRITNSLSSLENLKRMSQGNYWLMIRGHDHYPSVSSLHKTRCKSGKGLKEHWQSEIRLDTERRYIISLGSFKKGHYSILNSRNLTLKMISHWGERTD